MNKQMIGKGQMWASHHREKQMSLVFILIFNLCSKPSLASPEALGQKTTKKKGGFARVEQRAQARETQRKQK